MNESERRQHPRHEIEIGVTIWATNLKVGATLVDIGGGGIGVVSEKAIDPGSNVHIAIDGIKDYFIEGVVKWSYPEKEKTFYRMGIETESIILNSEMQKDPSLRSELMEKLRAETKQTRPSPDSHPPRGSDGRTIFPRETS